MRVKCLAQEHNTMSLARAQPGPLPLESSALTMRLPHLGIILMTKPKFQYPIYDYSVANVSAQNIIFKKIAFSKQHTSTIQD